MRLIKPSFEILDQQCGLEGIYKQIEIAGRTCYKSEDKITEDSAKGFVDSMVKSGHGAMLEHGTVYLRTPVTITGGMGSENEFRPLDNKYRHNKYSVVHKDKDIFPDWLYVTTNYRVLIENGWLNDLKYICEPTEYHEKRITVRFVCDRGVSHEFVRHRVFSFAQESTRYCNYSKSKFNNEITFIIPCWTDIPEGDYGSRVYPKIVQRGWHDGVAQIFIDDCRYSEDGYFRLLNEGWTPQQARVVLPNALKTELVMTGFVSDWKHFFELRDAASAHPQAQELAHPLHEAFIQRGLIE